MNSAYNSDLDNSWEDDSRKDTANDSPANVSQAFPAVDSSDTPRPVQTSRRNVLASLAALGIGTGAFQRALANQVAESGKITAEMVADAQWIAGIELDADQQESVAKALQSNLASATALRKQTVDADVPPTLVFRPDFFYQQASGSFSDANQPQRKQLRFRLPTTSQPLPNTTDENDLAFSSMHEQIQLLQSKKISSVELTKLYLNRLEKYDPLLKCVVSLLDEHALQLARESDVRRTRGQTLGWLDGIPWVAKDLIAIPPFKTTWGCEEFKDQVRTETATVAAKMEAAGAVLLAKATLGALAWGDVWFGGKTRNPWNPKQGSSGSSAGSAASVAAGLAAFALGSETYGSIVSPTRRCRVCGLRPTFGRVSRAGCMPLSWSMDKIGPIARTAEDLAAVFALLIGKDGHDPTVVEREFHWPVHKKPQNLRIGVGKDRLNSSEQAAVEFFRKSGASIVEIDLSSEQPLQSILITLGIDASTVFDDAFRKKPNGDFGMWNSTFRDSQFLPAVQYVRANRARAKAIVETEEKLQKVDFVIGGNDLLLTNLTGHPSIVVTSGEVTQGAVKVPGVVKLTSAAYREDMLLHAGKLLQKAIPPSPQAPQLDYWLSEQSQAAAEDVEE